VKRRHEEGKSKISVNNDSAGGSNDVSDFRVQATDGAEELPLSDRRNRRSTRRLPGDHLLLLERDADDCRSSQSSSLSCRCASD